MNRVRFSALVVGPTGARRFTGPASAAAFATLTMIALCSHASRAEIPVAEAYQLHCSGCHGPTGRGDGRIVPSLRELGPVLEASGGREYLGRVPGVAQAPLPSTELAKLLNFILSEFSGMTSFAPFTASEVETLRHAPLRDPIAQRPVGR